MERHGKGFQHKGTKGTKRYEEMLKLPRVFGVLVVINLSQGTEFLSNEQRLHLAIVIAQ
jgi:hypothetical protein